MSHSHPSAMCVSRTSSRRHRCCGVSRGSCAGGGNESFSPCRQRRAALIVIVGLALRVTGALGDYRARADEKFRVAPRGNAIMLPVRLASKRCNFLLDTGSGVTIVDASLKGLLRGPAGSYQSYTTLDQDPLDIELYQAPPLFLGTRRLHSVSRVACVDFRERGLVLDGRAPDGFLGADALRDMIVKVDFDGGDLSLLSSVPDNAGTPVPMAFYRGVPTVPVAIPGLGTYLFGVDTGCIDVTSGNISTRLLQSLLDARAASVVGESPKTSLAREATTRDARLNDFSLGEFQHRGLVFSESAVGSLSLGYLSRYVVVFDFPGKKMYLTPGKRFNEEDRRGLSGLGLQNTDGAVVVTRVKKGWPADRAGVRTGDSVLEIDGIAAASLLTIDRRRMFSTPSTRRLTIRRGGETLRLKLELRDQPQDNFGSVGPRHLVEEGGSSGDSAQ